jgi:hypothetical protein
LYAQNTDRQKFFSLKLIVEMAAVVLARAGLVLARWSRVAGWLVWVVVAFAAVSLMLNLITPSASERAIWAPVALLLLMSSAVVAITRPSGRHAR